MSLIIGGVAVGATLATAAAGAVVSYGVNSLLSGDGSASSSSGGVMNGTAPSASSSSIQNAAPQNIGTSEAAKTYDPVEQMNKWNKIFNGFGEEK